MPCRLFCLRTWSLHKRYALLAFLHVHKMCMRVRPCACAKKADWPSCFHGLVAVHLCDCVCHVRRLLCLHTWSLYKRSICMVYLHSCMCKCSMYMHVCKTPVSQADFKADSIALADTCLTVCDCVYMYLGRPLLIGSVLMCDWA